MLSNTHFSMAVHVLCGLAYEGDELVGSERLARTVRTNPSFLRTLIGQLREGGLVVTRLGKGGGSKLARPADRITLFDVYRVTEHRPALTTHDCTDSPCVVAKGMQGVLKDLNTRIERTLETELSGTTIADLVSEYIQVKA